MRNLVSNGIKFSERGGEVSVDATRHNGKVLFEVQDSGIGIPEEIQQRIFKTTIESRSGTLNERGSGIGLHLCKQFIEEQEGEIGFESKEGKGSRF
ncbi:MAG: ATP-binding protein [Balneolaceae bacterium]|nr:ATP-binding protein [Balneolaceae bacterium]